MENFKKVVHLGRIKPKWTEKSMGVFCKIEYVDGRLSISGVEGPTRSGNARGSCGQIIMSYTEYDKRGSYSIGDITPAVGWDRAMLKRFFDAWDKWHLNDMRAGCEHQTGAEWEPKEVIIYHYALTMEALKQKNVAKDKAIQALTAGETFTPSANESFIASLPYSIETWRETIPEHYERAKDTSYSHAKETKMTNWLRPREHPEGYLCKPCPVCGYKYGSAWRTVEVPEDVLQFLASLPSTDIQPAWV